jgi:hypothetical protein
MSYTYASKYLAGMPSSGSVLRSHRLGEYLMPGEGTFFGAPRSRGPATARRSSAEAHAKSARRKRHGVTGTCVRARTWRRGCLFSSALLTVVAIHCRRRRRRRDGQHKPRRDVASHVAGERRRVTCGSGAQQSAHHTWRALHVGALRKSCAPSRPFIFGRGVPAAVLLSAAQSPPGTVAASMAWSIHAI